jgi:phosphatidylethanolamine/phosphatidyl-N-methylethanolamine N-methyltransferase
MRRAAAELNTASVRNAYSQWAPVYDGIFGPVFARGRRVAIAAADRLGGRILEVGVGTGISLPGYSRNNRIVGVDLSEAMLRKAERRVARQRLGHVEGLYVMDAERLSFPDASFDVVAAHYVVSTVPHPESALDEFARVLRPGGQIIILSRVGAATGLRRRVEAALQPVAGRLGWRTDFPWEHFARWLDRRPDIRLIERTAIPPLGHFALIRFERLRPPSTP